MYVHVLFEMFHTNLKHAFLPTYLSPFHLVSKDYLLLLQCLNFANTSASFVLWIVTERSHVQVHLAVYFVACFINCFTCVICMFFLPLILSQFQNNIHPMAHVHPSGPGELMFSKTDIRACPKAYTKGSKIAFIFHLCPFSFYQNYFSGSYCFMCKNSFGLTILRFHRLRLKDQN